jgi:hypothetical protein
MTTIEVIVADEMLLEDVIVVPRAQLDEALGKFVGLVASRIGDTRTVELVDVLLDKQRRAREKEED